MKDMKRKLCGGLLAALATLLLGIFLASPAMAEDAHAATGGTLSDSVSWSLDNEGALTIYPTNGVSGSYSLSQDLDYESPWNNNSNIVTATVSATVTVDDATSLFYGCTSLTTVDLSGLDTSSVTGMSGMFSRCSSLTTVDLSGLDTSNVVNMNYMFYDCTSLTTVDLSGLNMSNVASMDSMFSGCSSLSELSIRSGWRVGDAYRDYGSYSITQSGVEYLLNNSMGRWQDEEAMLMALEGGVFHGEEPHLDNLDENQVREIFMSADVWDFEIEQAIEDGYVDTPLIEVYLTPFADQSEPSFYRVDDHSNTQYAKSAAIPTGVAATYSVHPYTAPAPSYPTIPLTLTLEASKATNTAGMTFTFNPLQQPVVAEEEGAHAVPRWDSNDDGAIDSTDDYVLPQSTTLTAAAMDGYTQDITGSLALPDPALYGHAGVYAYEVTQQIPVSTGTWDYSEASYKVRVYVVNGEDGLEYAETPITIESIEDDEGDPVAKTDGYGPKVARMLFTNVNTATTNLQVTKDVTGAYGNHAKEFPFTLTVNLPSWASDDSFVVTTTGTVLTGTTEDSDFNTIVTTSSGTATITFNLAHGQSLSIAGLPVGTTFSTSETDSTDGVNVYVPSATYFFDGATGATGDYADNTTNYTATLDSNSVPATNITVNATAAAANASTMLGEGTGNLVTVTNDLSNPPSPTGIAMAMLPYALMMAIAAGALLVLRNRKREDDIA